MLGEVKTRRVSVRLRCDCITEKMTVAAGSLSVRGLNEKKVELRGDRLAELDLPAPGRYWIQAAGEAIDYRAKPIGVAGAVTLDLDKSQPAEVVIHLMPNVLVRSEVVVDGKEIRPEEVLPKLVVKLASTLGMSRLFGDAEMPARKDGSFGAAAVRRSTYAVELNELPAELYVKSMRWGVRWTQLVRHRTVVPLSGSTAKWMAVNGDRRHSGLASLLGSHPCVALSSAQVTSLYASCQEAQ